MDALITAAAHALARGDPLAALNRVALRADAAALALRGIAMAQLEQPARARELLRAAARAFGLHEARARARCVVAEAEVALASRDLAFSVRALVAAAETLESGGDRANALHARLILVRRALLLGRVDEAESRLAALELGAAPALHVAVAELARAEIALRRIRTRPARRALTRAARAARASCVPALVREIELASDVLAQTAACELRAGQPHALRLDEVEAMLASSVLVLDGCARGVRRGRRVVALARRPVLFALARALCEHWPQPVAREALIARAFEAPRSNESHRVRLRVEIGRLRKLCAGVARIEATADGFALRPLRTDEVRVLLPPIEGEKGALLALLADGQAWSSSALALALGASQRSVQRALAGLLAADEVHALGAGRTRRWLAPPRLGIATTLLLTTAPPVG